MLAALSGSVLALALVAARILSPSSTAEGVAISRYLLSDRGLLSEGISAAFFPWKAWAFTRSPRLRDAVLRGVLPGGAAHLATRTWFYDEHIRRLLAPHGQLVVCGAGFDSRAYRVHAPRGARFFELDLPEAPGVQRYKLQRLAAHGIATDQVTHLPIDFKRDSVAEVVRRVPLAARPPRAERAPRPRRGGRG
jgi:O-methyltransferase involved in polyketide biosynthesis